jgi:Putative zinc dependent peptidase (DUF5700)
MMRAGHTVLRPFRSGRRLPGKALICLAIAAFLSMAPGSSRDPRRPIGLRDLVPRGDPLGAHDVSFDARFAQDAYDYLTSNDPRVADRLAELPATAHLLAHARQFDYSAPKESARALAAFLLSRSAGQRARIAASLSFFTGPLLDDPHWVHDALRYLPPDFRFHGGLFLVSGYDIGVALAPDASLNAAHAHFDGHSRELLYYAIHELHHVGLMAYQPPPRIADLHTCADLLKLVDYSTALEGTAVLAALDRRTRDGALKDDEDYVALADEARMRRDEAQYFDEYDALARRGIEPADEKAFAVIDRMSGGERLWYRVGARMAARIERARGRSALVALITREPGALVRTYRALSVIAPAAPQ